MGKDVNSTKEKLSISVMIFSIVGLVLVILGFLLIKNNNFIMQIMSTEGVVTGINTSNSSDGSTVSRVLSVTYNANRGDYTATINDVNSKLNIGDKKTLYYDILEPTSVSDRRAGYHGYVALIIGIVLVLKNGPRFYRIIRDNYLMG